MKKVFFLIASLVCLLCASSCQKENSGAASNLQGITYWEATLSTGTELNVRFERLSEPIDLLGYKCPLQFVGEIKDVDGHYANISGPAYQENNIIEVLGFGGGYGRLDLPETYEYDGRNLSCECDGAFVLFSKISKEEFWDSISGYREEDVEN